ncbi:M48 family metallopeptidase [Demequina sp. NBRC 110052]|uniref:M48 family metallopeptidase n=1 Tax=Demequina sp. NBRC 110052 TaxID=1570341 RepID=UPI0013563909|nr:SprT family zinc-dependent metalloprotease [Demequina sp. NBRC 110052]
MLADLPEYTLTRKKMKNLRMRVVAPHGEVKVSAPLRTPVAEIDAFVASRASWIRKMQEKAAAVPAPLEAGPEAEAARTDLRRRVPPLLSYWAGRMEVVPEPHWSPRLMRTRWGSCNSRTRKINLSLELARRDDELLEYVIVHELAHLFEPNHGPGFYRVMDTYLPGWKALRTRLNGREL